jgi:hypothetical protein
VGQPREQLELALLALLALIAAVASVLGLRHPVRPVS